MQFTGQVNSILASSRVARVSAHVRLPSLPGRAPSSSSSASSSWRSFSASSSMALPSYEHELGLAIGAARLAARLCQSVQRNLLTKETQAKADKSPVTVADYGSQALVSWALERESSGSDVFSMVAEEDADDLRGQDGSDMLLRITNLVNEAITAEGIPNSSSLSKEDVLKAIDRGRSEGGHIGRHWVLDPIDGTKGFVRGDQYAVALALLDEGEVVLGVLACPNLPLKGVSAQNSSGLPIGCLFSARKGAGTMLQSLDDSFAPLQVHVSDIDDPAFATFCESFESAHSRQSLTERIAKIMGVKAPPVRIDSQAKYGAMARGDAAIYLRFPHQGYREKIWDHAAGCIVIEARRPTKSRRENLERGRSQQREREMASFCFHHACGHINKVHLADSHVHAWARHNLKLEVWSWMRLGNGWTSQKVDTWMWNMASWQPIQSSCRRFSLQCKLQ